MDESKAGSSPYGIFIYLELRKDSREDFSFLSFFGSCFTDELLYITQFKLARKLFCEVKIPEECTPTRSDSELKSSTSHRRSHRPHMYDIFFFFEVEYSASHF